MILQIKHRLLTSIHAIILSIFSLSLLTMACWAENASLTQAKTKLKRLDQQINTLKQTLASAQDKRGVLNQELAGTEKQISDGIRKLRLIQRGMDSKQRKISLLQQHVTELNQQLAAQQQLLAQHVRTRYKMGEYQPLKWLLNQDDPYAISRLLTFYQYLVQSRQNIIDQIDATKKTLPRTIINLKMNSLNNNNYNNNFIATSSN